MDALLTAIKTKYDNDSDLSGNTNDLCFTDTANPVEEVIVQFNIHSDTAGATEITTLYNYLTACYDWCNLSVTGYNHLMMERTNSILFLDDNNRWQYTVNYKILLEKS